VIDTEKKLLHDLAELEYSINELHGFLIQSMHKYLNNADFKIANE